MNQAACSDKGKKRLTNEDSYLLKGRLLAVADGMGGHQAGEIASQTALSAVSALLAQPIKSPRRFLEQAFANANREVRLTAEQKAFQGMGTTLTVALINNNELWIGHIGDSRAYLITDGQLKKLTTDHSLVGSLVQMGQLSEEEAKTDPRKHVITKAIGSQKTAQPDITVTKFKQGDRLLLCTDGLTNELTETEILNLAVSGQPAVACQKLVALANERGGADNITVVIANLEKASLPKAEKPFLKRSLKTASLLLAAVVLALTILYSFNYFLAGQYFLAFKKGKVAVYQGWPAELGSWRLWRYFKTTKIKKENLPAFYQQKIRQRLYVGNQTELNKVLKELRQVMRK